MSIQNKLRIVTLGGGSGQPALLHALAEHDDVELSAIVTTMDSGGSSGILREAYGIIPPGDVRRCLSALSSLRNIDRGWNYRSEKGPFAGHPIGNVVLTQLTEMYGDMQMAIGQLEQVLRTRGHVYPVSRDAGVLCAELVDGSTIVNEHEIDVPKQARKPIVRVYLESPLQAAPEVVLALQHADIIVLSFGDVWTSMIPNLLVNGVTQAIVQSKAPVILVCNRSTKKGETDGWSYADVYDCVSRYLQPARIAAMMCDDQSTPMPTGYDGFIPAQLPSDVTVITQKFADANAAQHMSADRVAQAILSYARLH